MDIFLKAKHWQLFTLMFGIPVLFQVIMMLIQFSNISSGAKINPAEMFKVFEFFPIIMILYMGVFFGWFWSIAIGLQKKVPENITMKTKKFKVFFFIPVVYLIFICLFIVGIFSNISQIGLVGSQGFIGLIAGIILPLHLLSIFGMFYSMYFVAKTFKTVELQKEVRFGEFAGEFFMIWFYFIGIWILQPKINKIVENENITTNHTYN